VTGRVAVSGVGAVTAPGVGVGALLSALRRGEPVFRRVEGVFGAYVAAPLASADLEAAFAALAGVRCGLSQRAFRAARRAPRPVQVAVLAALEAWTMARLDQSPLEGARLGVVVGGSNLTSRYELELGKTFEARPNLLSPSFAQHFLDSDHVGVLSEIFGIHGEGFTVGGASASGNVAIIKATQMIRHGIVDACLVVGALADLSPLELQSFVNVGAMGGRSFLDHPGAACRPFDARHEGFIYGQGSAAVVLEREESARGRGAPLCGHVRGVCLRLAGRRDAAPSAPYEAEAMRGALVDAGLGVCDIGYVNAHGTSSPAGDHAEIAAIAEVFGEHTPSVWVSSSKSIVGHTLYAAGVVELVATLLQLDEGFLHPIANLHEPISPVCRFVRGESVQVKSEYALSNSFGFGGVNTSIVIQRGEPAWSPRSA